MKHEPSSRRHGENRKAVVLLSGGLDSTTTVAEARAQGFEVFALTVRYGQRHEAEVEAARHVARQLSVAEHVITDVNLRAFGGSALTGDLDVPKHVPVSDIGGEIPVTYVPARNTILLSLALAWAEVLEAADIFLGVNALDYSGYPDCRPEFIAAFERLATLATKAGIEGKLKFQIHTPLINLSKSEIILRGLELGVDYGQTVSCYDPDADGKSCGSCDACTLRRRGFEEAGVEDPAEGDRWVGG